MTGSRLAPRLYARALQCYPRAFRHAFADSMLEDFLDATSDARRGGRLAVAACWGRIALDLTRSLAVQWLRRPQPWLALVGALCAIICVQAIVTLAPGTPGPPPVSADDEAQVLVLIVVAALFPVVAVILFVWSFLPPIPPGRRRRA